MEASKVHANEQYLFDSTLLVGIQSMLLEWTHACRHCQLGMYNMWSESTVALIGVHACLIKECIRSVGLCKDTSASKRCA